ncbi:MAG: hypothetical protein KDA58_14230, partial [Planctomycetaceae bacterium]|nr:hypothetical protein [Planctomycetaceae bacterium]
RWCRSPLRIVPGMEMPNYQRPVPNLLDEDVVKQLALVWRALQDPKFTAPTNPSQVEQFLTVVPRSAPRIVRDVFELPATHDGGYVARSYAVGFNNGHSVLFDLDRGSVRQWAYGDFARQRAEGKSWFWDLAGNDLVPNLNSAVEWRLRDQTTDSWLRFSPTPAEGELPFRPRGWAYLIGPGRHDHDLTLTYEVPLEWKGESHLLVIQEIWTTVSTLQESLSGWVRSVKVTGVPTGAELALRIPVTESTAYGARLQHPRRQEPVPLAENEAGYILERVADGDAALELNYLCDLPAYTAINPPVIETPPPQGQIDVLPGYVGERLPLPPQIMPTSLAWSPQGWLLFTSLKGHVFVAEDTTGDGLEDRLQVLEEGLAAPFGLLVDGNDLLVAHKPEILRLANAIGADRRPSVETRRRVELFGWGYNENYHDWTTGPVRNGNGPLIIGLGSDYSQPKRPLSDQHLRGSVLEATPSGELIPLGRELRYPMGLAYDAQGRLFATDQQGVQNTFNELNHITAGRRYGVPGQEELRGSENSTEVPASHTPAAVQIPHPWTRSVNGLFFLPTDGVYEGNPFAGHGIGCEYNTRFLLRFTLQEVDGELQGAVYPFTRIPAENDLNTFLGPMCGGVAPNGDIYIGSIHDSGWLGGLNTGEIVRLRRADGPIPNGLREVRLTADGFELELIQPLAAGIAADQPQIALTGYTRKWSGSYATPDSDRYSPEIAARGLSLDRRLLRLQIADLRPGFVYEIQLSGFAAEGESFFPDFAAYTVNRKLP